MKKLTIILFLLLITNTIFSQNYKDQIVLKYQDNKTWQLKGEYKYKVSNDFHILQTNRKIIIFHTQNKNYKVDILGVKTKQIKTFSNRSIIKTKGIFLPKNNILDLVLTEYK